MNFIKILGIFLLMNSLYFLLLLPALTDMIALGLALSAAVSNFVGIFFLAGR